MQLYISSFWRNATRRSNRTYLEAAPISNIINTSWSRMIIIDMENVEEETLVRDAYIHITQKIYPDGCTANKKQVIKKKSLKLHACDSGEIFLSP